eukprot:CAMPEP_0116051942 /NCGR_PEP_ID=MMETSP0322-20121206/1276_1 /TAXON_ID=163516 /ORGANISM="Leptocylindrus danicus var. apora, Strain B651" /LENGTH=350 /DNA_ID=CAMNT_0003534779 /DNA_START=274 /DNA_END=1326 /DNA_ORIENTATION=-
MHGDHMEAGRLIIQAALSTEPLSIEKRSSYLSRALGSYSTLEHNGSIAAHQLVEEVQNYVDVLNVQSRINAVVESNVNLRGLLDAAGLEQLSKTVVSADDLLNDFAAKLQMWDFCLIIIHCCRKRDVEFDGTIQKLWYTIMSEILPSRVEDPSANQIAAKLLQRIHDQSIVEKQDRGVTFETGAWITSLKTAVITLGSELYGSGADHTFPVTLVLGELESLRRVFATISCSDIFRNPWPLQAFLDIGCPYIVIVQAYDSLLSMAESEGAEVSERFHFLGCIGESLKKWIKDANTWAETENKQRNQLLRAIAGGLRNNIADYRSKIDGNESELGKRIELLFTEVSEGLSRF